MILRSIARPGQAKVRLEQPGPGLHHRPRQASVRSWRTHVSGPLIARTVEPMPNLKARQGTHDEHAGRDRRPEASCRHRPGDGDGHACYRRSRPQVHDAIPPHHSIRFQATRVITINSFIYMLWNVIYHYSTVVIWSGHIGSYEGDGPLLGK